MSHLKFNTREEKAKTKVFDVISDYDKTILGKIYWYGPWRQYVFEPTMSTATIWSDDCLSELYGFIHQLKEDRKVKKGIISIDPYTGKVLKIKKQDGELIKVQDRQIKIIKEAVNRMEKIINKYKEGKNNGE